MEYTVILFKQGKVTELVLWAESIEIALCQGHSLARANQSDEFMLRKKGV